MWLFYCLKQPVVQRSKRLAAADLKDVSFTENSPSKEWATLEFFLFSRNEHLKHGLLFIFRSKNSLGPGNVCFQNWIVITSFQIFILCIFICFYYVLSDSCEVDHFS